MIKKCVHQTKEIESKLTTITTKSYDLQTLAVHTQVMSPFHNKLHA